MSITPMLLDADEGEFVLANIQYVRALWLEAYHGAVSYGAHDRADYYLDHVLQVDRVIAKVEAQGVANPAPDDPKESP